MSKKKKVLLLIAVLLVIIAGVGIYFYTRKRKLTDKNGNVIELTTEVHPNPGSGYWILVNGVKKGGAVSLSKESDGFIHAVTEAGSNFIYTTDWQLQAA